MDLSIYCFLSDSPEIEIDQTWIPTKDGLEAEVACNIHAEPAADVSIIKEVIDDLFKRVPTSAL